MKNELIIELQYYSECTAPCQINNRNNINKCYIPLSYFNFSLIINDINGGRTLKNITRYKTSTILIIVIAMLLVIGIANLGRILKKPEPTIKSEDIIIKGILKENRLTDDNLITQNSNWYKYIIELSVDNKNKKMLNGEDYYNFIYPYVDRIGTILVEGIDSNGKTNKKNNYLIGTFGKDVPLVREQLKDYTLDTKFIIGFSNNDLVDSYNCRVYIPTDIKYDSIKNPCIVYIHHEIIKGKDVSWAKIIPLEKK